MEYKRRLDVLGAMGNNKPGVCRVEYIPELVSIISRMSNLGQNEAVRLKAKIDKKAKVRVIYNIICTYHTGNSLVNIHFIGRKLT